jgi:hypothetical protein
MGKRDALIGTRLKAGRCSCKQGRTVMMKRIDENAIANPVDMRAGGDADMPGIAQPVTSDDIQAILAAPFSIEERKERLLQIRNDLQSRRHADGDNDMALLIAEVEGALEALGTNTGVETTRSYIGMDREERSDLRSPDE